MKKILVVVESIDVEDSSGSKANVAFIKNLHKAGFDLRVFHYTRKDVDLPGISCFQLKENRRSFLFFLSRLERYIRYWIKINPNKYIESTFGFSFTLFNDRNSIVAGLKKNKEFDADLVLTLSKGASFRPHHALLKIPKWHAKWMAYIHDPYPFASYPRPYDYVEPGHQQKRKFFLMVADKARYAAYPSKLLADWMQSYYGSLKEKTVIIPHQISEDEVKLSLLPKYFKKETFSIVHAGALMSARNPLGLIKGFRKFLEEVPDASSISQLLFIGDKSIYTPEFNEIRKELPQFYSTDAYVPFSKVLAIQKNAAVNVILEAKGPISPFLPGKFPHCIDAEKPILLLGPHYSESRRLLGEDYPWWSEINDEEKIFEIIKELYLNWRSTHNQLDFNCNELKYYLSEKYLSAQFLEL